MADGEPAGPRNIHGRRWGRGFRPYLIVAKLLCVAAYVGGLMTLLVLMFRRDLGRDDEGWRQLAVEVHRAYAWLIVPAFVGAIVVGLLLTASMMRAMARMRWFQLKLIFLVAGAPALHVFLRSRSASLQRLVIEGGPAGALVSVYGQLLVGTVAGLLLGVFLLILGRVKPRLGQGYGTGR